MIVLIGFVGGVLASVIAAAILLRLSIDNTRMKWSNVIREDVSFILESSTFIRRQRSALESAEKDLDMRKRLLQLVEDESKRLRQLDWQVRVLLDPGEKQHARLDTTINSLVQKTLDLYLEDAEFFSLRKEVFSASRDLVREEMNKIMHVPWLLRWVPVFS